MNKILNSFLITTLSGLSTLLGIIPCLFNNKNKDKIIVFSLSLSSGVMSTISIISLTPESINYLNNKYLSVIFILLGFLFAISIDKLFTKNSNSLYRLGLISTLAIILHNIPEGIMTFISYNINRKLGLKLALAITLHNIPEGISISVPIYYSTKNIIKSFKYTFIAGFSELLGAIITYLFLIDTITNSYMGYILGITAGIMLEISLLELLPTALKYKKNKLSIISFVLGIIIMIICNYIF